MKAGAVRDLQTMLKSMSPLLDDRPYSFEVLADGEPLPVEAFAIVREREGTTVVQQAGDDEELRFARITLQVHSDLEGVGLTAAVATGLAAKGIPCNVIAAFHHDHLFVPWDCRTDAISVLQRISDDARR
ncbi:MAG: ACT domain-containing protein [Pseudomonadota bacterium]